MTVVQIAKERARHEVIDAVVAEGRRQLREHGSSALSLRAVARELGMVSSAIYRFVKSRDELLTLLIVEAYDSLGARVERSVEDSRGSNPVERWVLASTAIREWALERPHEYALIYGSPVPDYAAPNTTIGPGTRPSLALLGIVVDAHHAHQAPGACAAMPLVGRGGPMPELSSDFDEFRRSTESNLDDRMVLAAINAWSQLFGTISFELFGQFDGMIDNRTEFFEASMRRAAHSIGLDRSEKEH